MVTTRYLSVSNSAELAEADAADGGIATGKRSILFRWRPAGSLDQGKVSGLIHRFGAHLAALKSVPNLSELSGPNLIGNLLFGSIGFVAFIYGKRQSLWKPMFFGLGLMVMPYFIVDTLSMYGLGAVGTSALFFLRD